VRREVPPIPDSTVGVRTLIHGDIEPRPRPVISKKRLRILGTRPKDKFTHPKDDLNPAFKCLKISDDANHPALNRARRVLTFHPLTQPESIERTSEHAHTIKHAQTRVRRARDPLPLLHTRALNSRPLVHRRALNCLLNTHLNLLPLVHARALNHLQLVHTHTLKEQLIARAARTRALKLPTIDT
jgi:hypothetical protein